MPTIKCSICSGTGMIEVIDYSRYVKCYYCNGKGLNNNEICSKCQGNKVIYYLKDDWCRNCSGTGEISF